MKRRRVIDKFWRLQDITYPYGVAIDAKDNIFIAYHNSVGITIRKLSNSGVEIKENSNFPYGFKTRVNKNTGNILVAYNSLTSPAANYGLCLFDNDLNLLWSIFASTNIYAIDFYSNGDIFVASDNCIYRLDASGNILRSATGYTSIYVGAIDKGENIIIPAGTYHGTIYKVDGSNSNTFGTKLKSGTSIINTNYDYIAVNDIAVDSQNNICVIYSNPTSWREPIAIFTKFDTNLNVLKDVQPDSSWGGYNYYIGTCIALDKNDNAICGAYTTDVNTQYSSMLFKLDSDCNRIWSETSDGKNFTDVSDFTGIACNSKNNFVCVNPGYSFTGFIRKLNGITGKMA